MPWSKAGNLCGPTAVSTDAGNSSRLGSDGLLFTPTPAASVLPVATASQLGGIKIGSGLSIDATGVVTASGGTGAYLPLAGGTLTGDIVFPSNGATGLKFGTAATRMSLHGGVNQIYVTYGAANVIWFGSAQLQAYVPVLLPGDPTTALHAAPKRYVDAKVAAVPAYTLPAASASVLGGIKIGSGLTIDANGVVSTSVSGSYLDKRGDAMSGPLRFSPTASPSTFNGVDAYLYQHSSNSNLHLAMPGGRAFVFGADGTLTSAALPSSGSHLTNKTYVDNAIAQVPPPDLTGYLQRSGGVMSGPLRFAAITPPSTYNGSDFYAFQANGNLLIRTPQSGTVQVNGDGTVSAAAPTAAQHLIRKDYGDSHYAAKAAMDALSSAVDGLRAELEQLRRQLSELAAASSPS